MQDTSQETDEIDPNPQSTGYMVSLSVTPTGYRVEGPLPLPAEPSESTEEPEEDIANLTDALKHVLSIIKSNPLDQNDQEQMKSGYESQ